MTFNNKEHIFFDLDHTLWDFDKNSALTFEKIFELNKLAVNLNDFLEVYVPINFKYWKLYREEKVDKKTLKFSRLNDAFKAMEIDISSRMVHKLSDDYITHLCTFNHLFAGAIDLLDYLTHKYQLHIITNGFKEAQQAKLNQSNIDHYFLTVTNSEMVGVKKPNPKIFHHALHMANATIVNSIMIGDNLEADILGALNIGMDAICFNYHNEVLGADIIGIDHLLEIKNYL
jgi:putative hydrolase of the HAD superfamily